MHGNLIPFPPRDPRQTALNGLCGTASLFQNRYQILQILGKGGFGVTFLARDVSLPSAPLCVIKQLCPKIKDEGALVRAHQRFEREAKVLGELGGHAQIPMLLNYFEQGGEFFLVQEYVRGQTLSKLVKQDGVWTEDAVKQFLREVLPVLSYIHQHGVIHRDIKPPNLIRCEQTARMVLLDFGAVKEGMVVGESHSSATTHFVGTMGFAPPEQLALRATFATDIYALGVTCIFLLTGKIPAKLGTDARTGEIFWRVHTNVSDAFAQILDRMVKISIQDRYPTAEKVLKRLDLSDLQTDMHHCLYRQAPPPSEETQGSLEESVRHNYLPPTARMAASIRNRQDRDQPKGMPQNPWGGWNLRGPGKSHLELMYSHQ